MPAPTPQQTADRMRSASLALLGAAAQLDSLAGFQPCQAAPFPHLASVTARTLTHAELHRKAWCGAHGLPYEPITEET